MIAFGIMHFICLRSAGQMTMPDYVYEGQTRQYYVIPGPSSGSTYTWWVDGKVMPGYKTNEFVQTWNSQGTYLLEVQELSANGCPGPKISGLVHVNPGFICREAYLDIPNAFSPNGDGINDVWNIIGKDSYPDIEVTIYNRWGQAVWKSFRGYPVPWDGRSKGKAMPVDSYHYFIDLHDRSRPLIGTVTVVR